MSTLFAATGETAEQVASSSMAAAAAAVTSTENPRFRTRPAERSPEAYATLALNDPLALVDEALHRCRHEVQDYECIFTKQERVKGVLLKKSINRVMYRDRPFSVMFVPLGEGRSVKRALYVEGKLKNNRGQECMLVEPLGWRRILVDSAQIALKDSRVLSRNRNTIDQFGFRKTLERFQRVNRWAQQRGVLDLRYSGEGLVDGRPTFMLIRHLPYSGPQGELPDAKVILQLDQQWMQTVSVHCYSDERETKLLASYLITKVQFNREFADGTFEF
jgi:hypothetical protein